MTDQEMLELAAKAAGRGNRWWIGDARLKWNPLTDDGDALRLAVRLDIVPRVINGVAFAWRDSVCDTQESCGEDPLAATRRAIVRAAAEIGKAMKEAALRREDTK